MTNTNIISRGLAEQVLQETAVANADMFSKWISLRDVRDKIMHPFDRERLRLTYRAGNAWEALKEAADKADWLETRGTGLDMEIKATMIPVEGFHNLEEAIERINHLEIVFAHWKDIGHKLLLAEETIWNMKKHLQATDTRLMRSLALIFHYKTLANEFREMLVSAKVHTNLLRTLDPPSQQDLNEMWKGSPAKFGPLKLLLKDTGVLDDYDNEKE